MPYVHPRQREIVEGTRVPRSLPIEALGDRRDPGIFPAVSRVPSRNVSLDDQSPRIACPICGQDVVASSKGPTSVRYRLRGLLHAHFYKHHPGLGQREATVLLDQTLELPESSAGSPGLAPGPETGDPRDPGREMF